jgi:tetratricopeptide (TPR) repeat protein
MELSREQLAKMLLRGKRFALAAHEYRQIITSAEEHRWKLREYNWGDEEKINAFVWLLVTCPDAAVRNPAEAVQLAEKGLAYPGSQKNGNYWNTLGVARYYAGNWTGSIAALAKSIQLRGGGDSFDFFILAMAHRQLGDTEQPQQWYDRAVQWMEKHQPQDEELCRFRGEAAALLKIEATPGEKPE